jgi:putative flavoprotein involved in K+ transport
VTVATERIETVVVGAGQAGLAVGYHLAKRGRPFVIVDELERVGDNWRRHYDSLRLYNPARLCALPGMRFPKPGWRFVGKDEFADYLERYAARFELPVRSGTRVERVSRNGRGYLVDCGDARLEAGNVVVATGTFGRPFTPAFAADLDPEIVQVHSSTYKRPSELKPGPVLIVGAAHSGADVAMDVAGEHDTILCGRDTGQIPLNIEGLGARIFGWRLMRFFALHVATLRTPIGRHMRSEIRSHGGPMLRYKREHLDAAGVERVAERVVGVRDGIPELEGGRVLDVANVVWCTGFKQDFSWIDAPVIDETGWPEEERGVVPLAAGLYFTGLAFQYAFSSMLILGAGRDAEYVAKQVAAQPDQPRAARRG